MKVTVPIDFPFLVFWDFKNHFFIGMIGLHYHFILVYIGYECEIVLFCLRMVHFENTLSTFYAYIQFMLVIRVL